MSILNCEWDRVMILRLFCLFFSIIVTLESCGTDSAIRGGKDGGLGGLAEEDPGSLADMKNYTHSLSNNKLTSRLANLGKARAIAKRLSAAPKENSSDSIKNLKSLIAVERIGGADVSRLTKHLQRLADLTYKKTKNVSGIKVSEAARLEVGIAALEKKDYSLAFFYFDELLASKNKRIIAGAYNGLGLLAMFEGRIPEAVENWQMALKSVSDYESALLNLGFMSLKFGHVESAKRFLTQLSDDWFAKSGLIVANRLMGSLGEASKLCNELVAKHPNHKPILFNCGVHEWQSNQNIPKAKKLISNALRQNGGPSEWDAQGEKVLGAINRIPGAMKPSKGQAIPTVQSSSVN